MPQKKSIHTKNYQDERILDIFLWFIENYLPQKKKRSSHAEFSVGKFESFNINKIKKLTSKRSKIFWGNLNNTTISFTVGKRALPYLDFFRKIKLFKKKFLN